MPSGPLAATQAGWFSAAVLAIGDGAVLSHRSAAAHWEFLPAQAPPVDVSVDRPVRSRRGIRVHEVRTLTGAETLRHQDIPITTPARTLLDLAASSLPDQGLQRAVHEAEVRRRVSVPALHRFLAEAKGRPGTKRLAAVIAPGPAPTRSAFEDRILALVDAHGLPRPRCNAHIHGVEVDFHWPEHGVVLEADGLRFHDTPVRRARDRAKQARLEARGQRVLRATWEQATGEPEQTVARLRGALADRPSGPH